MARSFVDRAGRGGGSDAEVEGIDGFLLQSAGAIAELGHGDAFHDFDDGFAHFLHHAANGAAGFVGAGTFFVEPFADTADGREGAFEVADCGGEGNFVGRSGEAVAAGNAAFAGDDACGLEVIENLFEEPFGDVLLVGNGLDSNDGFVVIQSQDQQRAQGIFATKRKFHANTI